MIDTVVTFTLSSYPGMGIQEALTALNEGLTEYANKVSGLCTCSYGNKGFKIDHIKRVYYVLQSLPLFQIM